MTARIGLVQQKGGVAKTTNAINIAGALAERRLQVLAVDMDPQGYLTHRLGFEDHYKRGSPNFADALKSPSNYDVRDLVVSHAEFDVLPSNIDMFSLEQDLVASGMRPRVRLRDLLEDVDNWDVIVVDSPPSLGPLNDNVVLATENLLVPVEADESSQLALSHLLRQLDTLEDNYGVRVTIRGIIVSNVSYPLDNPQKESIEWFEERFEGRVPVWVVRTRAGIKRAVEAAGSVFGEKAEDVDMREIYEEIAAEIAPSEVGR